MTNNEVADKLTDLIALDVDAVRAYQQALDNIEHGDIHKTITEFQMDHHQHIQDLRNAIRSLGETPPEAKPDIKGFFIEGFTAIRSMTGIAGALKAMRINEKLTNKTYHDTLSLDLPLDIKSLIQKNYQDEQRHLNYIEQAIENEVWENE